MACSMLSLRRICAAALSSNTATSCVPERRAVSSAILPRCISSSSLTSPGRENATAMDIVDILDAVEANHHQRQLAMRRHVGHGLSQLLAQQIAIGQLRQLVMAGEEGFALLAADQRFLDAAYLRDVAQQDDEMAGRGRRNVFDDDQTALAGFKLLSRFE